MTMSTSPRGARSSTKRVFDYDSDIERREALKAKEELETQLQQSIGMGPGRTGVKGVVMRLP